MDWKDILERAGWTFAQAFLAFILPVLYAAKEVDVKALGAAAATACVSGLAAGLSVIKNAIQQKLAERRARRVEATV